MSVVAIAFLVVGCLLGLGLFSIREPEEVRLLRAENAELKKDLKKIPELESEIRGLRSMAAQVAAMLGLEPEAYTAAVVLEQDSLAASGDWSWPVVGRISRSFEESGQRPHLGIDIAAEEGALIRSVANGVVVECGFRDDLGNFIVVDHGVVTSLYGHCKEVMVSNGQSIVGGAPIGKVGETGRASGPHLHLEVIEDGMPRNPLDFLPR
jgi:murein DD-endopeptidase MepM/ murein hydrolase activator NlpD